MPRVPRIHVENALYYVTSLGDHNKDIFRDDQDYCYYLDLIDKNRKELNVKFFAYCLLPQNLHLLIEPTSNATISQVMFNLHSTYTKYFNAKYNQKGHLFRERYKLVLIEKSSNLSTAVSYIHSMTKDSDGKKTDTNRYCSNTFYCSEAGPIELNSEREEVLRSSATSSDIQDSVKMTEEVKLLSDEISSANVVGCEKFKVSVQQKIDQGRNKSEKITDLLSAVTSNKKYMTVAYVALVLLIVFSVVIARNHLSLRAKAKSATSEAEAVYKEKLYHQREFIKKDLHEKYRADLVSYQAMSKRLEIEKNKVKELEVKVDKNE